MQTIAAPNPTPFRRPRYIRWPSVCDTTRVNWLSPGAEPPPNPNLQSHVQYVGCHPISDDSHVREATSTSSIIVSTPQSAWKTVALAAPSPEISPPNADLLATSVILAGAGIDPPQPPKARSAAEKPASQQNARKAGRPPVFDPVKRREFCAMVRAGSSLRNAAKLAGVTWASVSYACRTDPQFAELLRAAERARNMLGIDRVFHAGEKYWRAAAWMLERGDPEQFSRSALSPPNRSRQLSPRWIKQFVIDVVQKTLAADRQIKAHHPAVNAATDLIDQRLAEIEALNNRPPGSDNYDWTEGGRFDISDWDDDDPQTDGQPAGADANGDGQAANHAYDEAAADAGLQELRRLLRGW